MMAEAPSIDWQRTLSEFTYDPSIYGDRFKDDQTRDLTIAVGGGDKREVRIHKALMKFNSPHWNQFFTSYPAFALLLCTGCKFEDVEDVVNIMYKGKEVLLEIPEERRLSVVTTSMRLKFRLFPDFEEY